MDFFINMGFINSDSPFINDAKIRYQLPYLYICINGRGLWYAADQLPSSPTSLGFRIGVGGGFRECLAVIRRCPPPLLHSGWCLLKIGGG
jgi:hypothetical protein